MSLTRFATIALGVFALAGCESAPENRIESPSSAPSPAEDSATMQELINRSLKTSDLGVGQLKDPAKTVGYAPGSTEPGEKLLDGALIVDHVTRQDADNHFGVTVCVFNNRDDAPAVFEWRIAFYTPQGVEVGSLEPGWSGKAIDAKRWGTVTNSAAVRGATTFKLVARAPEPKPAPAP